MPDPINARIITNDSSARPGTVQRIPLETKAELSDADVDRIAKRVVELLDARNATPKTVTEDDPYFPRKSNKPQRPMSEF